MTSCRAATGTRWPSPASWRSPRRKHGAAARRELGGVQDARRAYGVVGEHARTAGRRWPTAWSTPTGSAAATTAGCSASTAVPRAAGRERQHHVPRPGQGQGRRPRSWGPGLGVRRSRSRPRAAPLRRLRDGRHPRRRPRPPPCNFVQIMENAVDPHHVEWLHGYYFEFLGQTQGFDAPPSFQKQSQGRVRRVRVGHHQAPGARGCRRGGRRLGHRAPADLPACASAARGSSRCRSGDHRPLHHPVHALLRCTHRGREYPGNRLLITRSRSSTRTVVTDRLRRGSGHHGLGHPGPDHRPDRGAPGPLRRRRHASCGGCSRQRWPRWRPVRTRSA